MQENYLAEQKSGPCLCFEVRQEFILQRNDKRDAMAGTNNCVCHYQIVYYIILLPLNPADNLFSLRRSSISHTLPFL